MPRFIITGCYSQSAMQGMMANPSDRSAASAALISAAGGKQEAFYATTGATDFMVIATADDVSDVIASLMAVGGTGAATNLQTQIAFTADEFTEIQKSAGGLAASYSAPS